jgi:hypothetical protein
MAEPIVLNTIERLGRALFATIAPATGVRGTGAMTVTAPDNPDPIALPRNTYLVPVVGGNERTDLLYKTTEDWVIPSVRDGATEPGVPITSNIGGARHNLPAGTVLRFDPPVDGIHPTATLDADMTDASDAGALIRSAGFYEDLDLANPSDDLFAARVGDRGVMLIWSRSEPAEGALGGMRQGSNRATRAARFWREHFVLYVVVSRLTGDTRRRQDGHLIVQAITRLLTDRHQNDDGEQLSTVGSGVEITERARLGRRANHYIYGVQLRVNQTLEATISGRTFAPWLRTHYEGTLPGREDPEPIQDLEVVDVTDPMP